LGHLSKEERGDPTCPPPWVGIEEKGVCGHNHRKGFRSFVKGSQRLPTFGG